ncbi:MAG: helix-turn-helix transcriptional regulator [Kiritimatiellia bacterium]
MKPFKEKAFRFSASVPMGALWSNRLTMGFPLHYHPEHEIHLIKKGEGVYSINGDLYKFGPRQLVTIRPNQVHSFISYSQNVPIEKYTVQFTGKWLKSAGLRKIDKNFPHVASLSDSHYRQAGKIIHDIIAENMTRRKRWKSNVRDLLCEFIAMAADLKHRTAAPGAKNVLYLQLAHYIESCSADPRCSATALAKRFGYSLSYLSALFKHSAGIGMKQFIIQCRINAARKLLAEHQNFKIASVAAQVGFNSYRHFVRAFLRQTGVTPAAYRKKCHARSKK